MHFYLLQLSFQSANQVLLPFQSSNEHSLNGTRRDGCQPCKMWLIATAQIRKTAYHIVKNFLQLQLTSFSPCTHLRGVFMDPCIQV